MEAPSQNLLLQLPRLGRGCGTGTPVSQVSVSYLLATQVTWPCLTSKEAGEGPAAMEPTEEESWELLSGTGLQQAEGRGPGSARSEVPRKEGIWVIADRRKVFGDLKEAKARGCLEWVREEQEASGR